MRDVLGPGGVRGSDPYQAIKHVHLSAAVGGSLRRHRSGHADTIRLFVISKLS